MTALVSMPEGFRAGAIGQPVRIEPCPARSAQFTGKAFSQGALNRDETYIAMRRYLELCESNSGDFMMPELHSKKAAERKVLIDQSHEIAQKLELAGIQGYTDDSYGLFAVGTCSGESEQLPNFRPIVFLPAHAQIKRAKRLRWLTCWLEKHPYCRFWTITGGQRCTVDELRERFQSLHRKISKLNGTDFMKDAGVRIVFRSSEIGGLVDEGGTEKRNESGQWLYHPHVHCIVYLAKGKMPSQEWSNVLRKVWSYVGCQFDDAGALDKVREAVKYCAKPSDICRHFPDELASLYNAMFNLSLVASMGEFAEFSKRLRDNRLDVRLVNTDSGRVWREFPCWNSRNKDEKPDNVDEIEHEKPDDNENKIVALTAPRLNSRGITEPFVIVRGLTVSPGELIAGHRGAKMARDAALEGYLMGRDTLDAIRLDTTTQTVRPVQAELCRNPVPKVLPPPKPDKLPPEGPRNWQDDPEIVDKLMIAIGEKNHREPEPVQETFSLEKGGHYASE